MSQTNANRPHVVVIGGGPAGSTAATLIAQQGHRVDLFEREHFPRFHIGESLIPETYWVLKRLNMLDKMKGSHFVKKYSVQFVNQHGKLSEPFYFLDHKPHESFANLASAPQRVRPDAARTTPANTASRSRKACACWRCCSRATGPSACASQEEDGTEREVRAAVVVDASGQSSIIMSRLGLREWDPVLKKAALWTYWEGAYRDTGQDEGATLVLQDAGQEGLVLVHPAAQRHRQRRRRGRLRLSVQEPRRQGPRGDLLRGSGAAAPASRSGSRGAKRVDAFRAAKEYSYRSRRAAGDGWVLVGDAFGFLDPLYSSGVLLALKSGQLAADAVAEGLAQGRHLGGAAGQVGGRFRQAAWTACGGWCANTTTASASAAS